MNDEGPTFDRSVYLVYTLDEDAEVGTEVVTVTASDPDSGENSVITYAIADGSDGGWFTFLSAGYFKFFLKFIYL